MSLRDQQSKFVKALGMLITYAYYNGFELTIDDVRAHPENRGHMRNSKHYIKLAADINLFKDGVYLQESSEHKLLGNYWKMLGGIWGGDFKYRDGNHYEWPRKG